MIDWQQHRVWLAVLAGAIILAVIDGPLIGYAQQKAQAHLEQTRSANNQAAESLQQLQSDIELTQKLETEIDAAEMDKFLAPIDRLHAVKILERRAAEARLSQFTYTLSPEVKMPVETVGAGTQDFAASKLVLSAEIPADTDAYVFFDSLHRTLPGRFALQSLTLERIGNSNAPITAANIRMTATGEWMSNGAPQHLAEGERK